MKRNRLNPDDSPSLTDSEEDEHKDVFSAHPSNRSIFQEVMSGPTRLGQNLNPGFGNMIKKFWSKYIYNGFVDIYNKGREVISRDDIGENPDGVQ